MTDIQSDKFQNHIHIPHHPLHMAQTSSTESLDQHNISDREIQPITNIRNQCRSQDKMDIRAKQ
jgi:hypothetical protein